MSHMRILEFRPSQELPAFTEMRENLLGNEAAFEKNYNDK